MIYQEYLNRAISYQQYLLDMKQFKDSESSSSLSEDPVFNNYTKMGYTRMKRIDKTAVLPDTLGKLISQLSKPITLLAITESWCGDSGQNLPYFNLLAKSSPLISYKLVYREKEPELMDHHLVNGSRSIPVVIFLDENLKPFTQWGPRPAFIQEQVKTFRSKEFTPEEYQEFSKTIQRQYNQDGGLTLYNEISEILTDHIRP